jgi:hypothetical protein
MTHFGIRLLGAKTPGSITWLFLKTRTSEPPICAVGQSRAYGSSHQGTREIKKHLLSEIHVGEMIRDKF